MKSNLNKGLTLIELSVMVVIMGLLLGVVFISLNTAARKSRDERRLSDMHQIVVALNIFYDQYGCLPYTHDSTCHGAEGYSQKDAGGWDYSSQGNGFMTFLKTSGLISNVPVDPINNMTGDSLPAGTYAYKYYCFPSGILSGPSLNYWRESDHEYVNVFGAADAPADHSFYCK